jgi:hypothetical protein
MKFTEFVDIPEQKHLWCSLELTRRNLQALLDKLDDPASVKTLIDKDNRIAVIAVDDDAHYSDRQPGEVFMPTSGERR